MRSELTDIFRVFAFWNEFGSVCASRWQEMWIGRVHGRAWLLSIWIIMNVNSQHMYTISTPQSALCHPHSKHTSISESIFNWVSNLQIFQIKSAQQSVWNDSVKNSIKICLHTWKSGTRSPAIAGMNKKAKRKQKYIDNFPKSKIQCLFIHFQNKIDLNMDMFI